MTSTTHEFTFPDELWLEILKDFNYGALRKMSRVCKHFRNLIKSPIFDKQLFRTPIKNATFLAVGSKVELHPAMEKINFVATDLDYALSSFTWNNHYENIKPEPTTAEISSWPFYQEFATNPTCTAIYIGLGDGALVKNAKGVTIADVIKKALACWNKKPSKGQQRRIAEWVGIDDPAQVTMYDTLGDHCIFEGWSPVSVVKGAKDVIQVNLNPGGFGS